MKTIGFCIPCYNEEENITRIYTEIKKQMKDIEYEYKILFIDNKSTDNSRTILKVIARKDKNVIVLMNTRNVGPVRSGAFGFFNTPGDAILTIACDLQDPPSLIPQFIKKWEAGNKLILGRKISSKESKKMYFIRKQYYKIMRLFISENELDQITGFGLYDRKIVNEMKKIYNPNPNFRFLITSLGFEVKFIDYVQPGREHGKSSYTFFSYLDTAIISLVENSNKPLRIISIFGLLSFIFFFILNIGIIIFSIINYCFSEIIIYIIACILFEFLSIIIGCIGIIGEYIGELLERSKQFPLVGLEESWNFDDI